LYVTKVDIAFLEDNDFCNISSGYNITRIVWHQFREYKYIILITGRLIWVKSRIYYSDLLLVGQ